MLSFLVRKDERSIDDCEIQLEQSWQSFKKRFRSEDECAYENYQVSPTGVPELDAAEQAVFGALRQGPISFDKLAERLSLPAGMLMAAITMLELKGQARCIGIQLFEACKPERFDGMPVPDEPIWR